MTWNEQLCLALNTWFPPASTPGGRESIRAYQKMQFHNAANMLAFYQARIDFRGKAVLDIGCGLGGKTVYYALQSGARSVIGVDIIESFVRAAADFAKAQNAADAAQFKVTSPTRLEFEANTFDILISNDTMEHVEQPEQLLQECQRVLKPGGYACIDFGPLYYSHKGAHIYDYINIPWCHLLFSQQTLSNAIRRLPEQPHVFGHDRTIVRFTTLNKLTVRRFRAIVTHLDFDIIYWAVGREKVFKRIPVYWLSFLSVLGNLFIHSITCVLRKK